MKNTTVTTKAVVIGANGGIGDAFVLALAASGRWDVVHALSRVPKGYDHAPVQAGVIDIMREDTIEAAAAAIGGPIDLLIVATGMLHGDGHRPERALREIDRASMMEVFAVNTLGPALVLKHFAPLLARERRTVVAALSARVGSISDNRSGGWYGYRASKAALNMIVRCAAIELGWNRPQCICVALHPGTVATALSRPFLTAASGRTVFTPEHAANQLLAVIDRLPADASGRCLGWDGAEIAP